MLRLDTLTAVTLLAALAGCSQTSEPNSVGGTKSPPTNVNSAGQPDEPPDQTTPPTGDATKDDAPTEITAMDGRVTVTFPGPAKHEEQTVKAEVGVVSFDSYKVQSNGVFWNLLITTYPPSVVAGSQDPMAFLQTRAEGNEKQKAGATRDTFTEIEESEYWAAEHRFTYPSGNNSQSGKYEAGFALHRYYLVDTSVVSVFVDVADLAYRSQSQAVDDSINRVFSSFTIRDE